LLTKHIVFASGVQSIEELWQLSEKSRIPKVMPFGKHKGEPIDSIPDDYRSWLLRQSDVDPYLLKALEK
jgi:exodeoxyribonuclease X